jgi:putative transposase
MAHGKSLALAYKEAGISQQSYYLWRREYGGLMPPEVRRLRQLEEENQRLKQLVADLSARQSRAAGCVAKYL